jgi:hypothetical protein
MNYSRLALEKLDSALDRVYSPEQLRLALDSPQ